MEKIYVQYGCDLTAPKEWINFDASPTLRIQKIPIVGKILKSRLNTQFPNNVLFGDIIKGLPIKENSCDGLYCSHTLEHLSLEDFRTALKNSYKILKKGGIFRCVVPDLESAARRYIHSLDAGDNKASLSFMGPDTLLGILKRPRNLKEIISGYWGNSHHLWMWDEKSLKAELEECGFIQIRKCYFHDSKDSMFEYVENKGRFRDAIAIECEK